VKPIVRLMTVDPPHIVVAGQILGNAELQYAGGMTMVEACHGKGSGQPVMLRERFDCPCGPRPASQVLFTCGNVDGGQMRR